MPSWGTRVALERGAGSPGLAACAVGMGPSSWEWTCFLMRVENERNEELRRSQQ